MFDAVGRHWRLFLLLQILFTAQMFAQSPTLTTITDTVYSADGSPAQGTLLISWPAFTTSAGQAVASGSESVALGSGGALSVALVPTQNAQPAYTVYTVVYQLNQLVKTEYWSVPPTSPANLATVRVTLGASNSAAQMATQQYVTSALSTKANDSAVVHLSGTETISGEKEFSISPSLPSPVQPTDAATKAYVDTAVQTTGSGSYLSTTGGTMSGPLVLNEDPILPSQAADKHYVDLWTSTKADLIAGYIPPSELASGTPSQNTCLLGNQTWGPCPSGGSSSYINSVLVANPNFNGTTPAPKTNSLNCSFQNSGSNVVLQCPYGNSSSTFALGSQAILNNQPNSYAGLQDFTQAGMKLPSGAGYAPSVGGAIGFDTNANMPVVNVNGVTQQLALTTSNISGQAATALSLANTPAQCSGSFATGIQANGNANCSTADVLQLAETSQPAGIANYGIFWFDSATHTPRIIDNNGQVAQLALMNVFNSDANTLEEYNSTNPQSFNLYGTRSDAADYERLRLGYDIPDGYFFLGADAAGSGTQRGLGFWMGGSLRWALDSQFNLKPWSDNLKDLGAPTLRVRHLYLGTYADLTGGGLVTELPNQSITGTALNKLAKAAGSPSSAVVASTSDTSVIGIVVDGAGTTGNAQIARDGQAPCAFDGPTTAGDYVQISGTIGGDCHDSGASYPGSGQILGRVLSSNLAAGTYSILIFGAELQAASQGAVSSIFGRTGAITAQVGDYSVSQITGAAPLNSPGFTGTATATTPNINDNSTAIATTAWVKNQNYGPGGSGFGLSGTGVGGEDLFLGNSTGSVIQASPAWFRASYQGYADPGGDYCKTMNNMINAVPPGSYLLWDIPGKLKCASNPFNGVTWTGVINFTVPVAFWTNTGWVQPTKVILMGTGESKTTEDGTEGTALVACPAVSSVCTSVFPTDGVLHAFLTSSPSAVVSGSGGTTEMWNFTLNCAYVQGCRAHMNYASQENAGLYWPTIRNSGNNGVAIDIGDTTGSPGGNSTNSSYRNLNVGNNVAPPGATLTCTPGAVLIRMNKAAGWPLPKEFSNITVSNGKCPQTATGQPNDLMQVNGVATEFGGKIHGEFFQRYGVNFGTTTQLGTVNCSAGVCTLVSGDALNTGWTGSIYVNSVVKTLSAVTATTFTVSDNTVSGTGLTYSYDQQNGAQAITLNSMDDCCHTVGTAAMVHIGSNSPAVTIHSLKAEGPNSIANMIVDDNNATISRGTTSVISTYITDHNRKVIADSTGVNPIQFTAGAVFSATTTAPTPTTTDNSTNVATTAFVKAQGYGTASGLISGNYPKANSTTGLTDSGVTAGPYNSFWAIPGSVSTSTPVACSGTASKAMIWGVSVPFPIKTSNITYYVVAADSTANTYDLGLYNASGTQTAHTGPLAGTTFAPTASHYTTQPWTTSNIVLQPGNYWLALSCSAISSTATFGYTYTWVNDGATAENVTTGGTLPASITVPGANSFSNGTVPQVVIY